jgi:hypothetical protein
MSVMDDTRARAEATREERKIKALEQSSSNFGNIQVYLKRIAKRN